MQIRRLVRIVGWLVIVGLLVGVANASRHYSRTRQIRQSLFDAIAPVAVTNCALARFGDPHDGGYLLCGNLLGEAQVGYSYGINGPDNWGCQISRTLNVAVHQYDCFNTNIPFCPGGDTKFHAECVGPSRATFEDRLFDSVADQVSKNGDAGKRIVMKMDVEGSEWQSLVTSPDSVLGAIDQLAIEFHEIEQPTFLATIERLKQFFYIAHVHMNNFKCGPGFEPFPGQVFEALLVNKRLAQIDPTKDARGPSPLDAPNLPSVPDCQALPAASELTRIGHWTQRHAREWYADNYNTWKDRLLPPY